MQIHLEDLTLFTLVRLTDEIPCSKNGPSAASTKQLLENQVLGGTLRAIARTLKVAEHLAQVRFIPPRAEPSVLDPR